METISFPPPPPKKQTKPDPAIIINVSGRKKSEGLILSSGSLSEKVPTARQLEIWGNPAQRVPEMDRRSHKEMTVQRGPQDGAGSAAVKGMHEHEGSGDSDQKKPGGWR